MSFTRGKSTANALLTKLRYHFNLLTLLRIITLFVSKVLFQIYLYICMYKKNQRTALLFMLMLLISVN